MHITYTYPTLPLYLLILHLFIRHLNDKPV